MSEARRHIEPDRPVIALVGCKLDLVTNGGQREVSREEAKAFADQHGLFEIDTSAKNGTNVEEAFRLVTQEVYNRIQTGEYKVEGGWDGIKTGFARPNGLDFNLVEAEQEKPHVVRLGWQITQLSMYINYLSISDLKLKWI